MCVYIFLWDMKILMGMRCTIFFFCIYCEVSHFLSYIHIYYNTFVHMCSFIYVYVSVYVHVCTIDNDYEEKEGVCVSLCRWGIFLPTSFLLPWNLLFFLSLSLLINFYLERYTENESHLKIKMYPFQCPYLSLLYIDY